MGLKSDTGDAVLVVTQCRSMDFFASMKVGNNC